MTGEPVIVSDLTSSISHSIELLLIAVLLVMAATLGLVFSGRPRLLPLALALLAAALTFGALSAVGASLTMASIAVLPVLVGLAVDYAIQFQARVDEEAERATLSADGAGRAQPPSDAPAVVGRAAALGAPTIATAAAASAAAMLVLRALAGADGARLRRAARRRRRRSRCCARSPSGRPRSRCRPAGLASSVPVAAEPLDAGPLAAAWRGARELLAENPLTRLIAHAALVGAVRRPGRVLCVGPGAGRARLGPGHADEGRRPTSPSSCHRISARCRTSTRSSASPASAAKSS